MTIAKYSLSRLIIGISAIFLPFSFSTVTAQGPNKPSRGPKPYNSAIVKAADSSVLQNNCQLANQAISAGQMPEVTGCLYKDIKMRFNRHNYRVEARGWF